MQLPALIQANGERWANAHYKAHWWVEAQSVAKRLCDGKAKAIYLSLQNITGVPWWAIALIHEREASQSWNANIAQGDPFMYVSRHIPTGRGPFKSFTEAAIDALTNCAPYAARWKDWTPGGALTLLELYNGEGYENYHHIASPYLWSGSDQYIRGKYVSDNHWDPNAVDEQLGCAIMLKAMMEIDPSITIATPPPSPENPDASTDQPPFYIDPATQPPAPVEASMQPPQYAPPPNEPFAPPQYAPPSLPPPQPPYVPQPPQYVPPTQYAPPGPSIVEQSKSLFKSKIAWLSNLVGIGSAGTVVASDDNLSNLFMRLIHDTKFWIVVMILVGTGVILYFRWRDHGKGSLRP